MDSIGHLISGFGTALAGTNLLSCFIGVLVGTLVGVLPGIGAVGTMAILLPITFSMGPIPAMIMLCGIFYGAQYGGSTTSILVNIPGEVGSIVTCLDGYQMAKQGRAGPALGISAIGSFIGGTLSIIGLILLTPTLAKLAIHFGPPELFSLVVFGLMMVTTIGRGSIVKSFVMMTLGLFVCTIGKESIKGFGRFTFESFTLSDGLGLVPVAVGMFGIAELLTNIEEMPERQVFKTRLRNLLPSISDWRRTFWPMIRGTVIGFFLGILPGGGTVITTFTSYALEKRLSRHPEKFGTGAIEGVAGPETANNAATSGSMVPLLGLGVPPHVTMAMLLGAFIIHGVQPGPAFISEHPDIFWGLIASMYIGNAMLLVLNLPLIGIWIQILKIPFRLLFPLVVLFCYVGVYSLNNNFYELLIMIFFGVVGYLLRKLGYDSGPFLLAMVLGPMLETSFRQSMAMSEGRIGIFLQRPLSAGPLILVAVVVLAFSFSKVRRGWKGEKAKRDIAN